MAAWPDAAPGCIFEGRGQGETVVAGIPELSIVVASWSDDRCLARCLESLAPQCEDAELIVATNRAGGNVEQLHSHARFVHGPEGASVFRLRSMGVEAARGRLVALIEDHAEAGPRWAQTLREAFRVGHRIIGGPVENGLTSRAVDWALYFVEYGYYMPPVEGGTLPRLSGLNIAYDRELLRSCSGLWKWDFQEKEINDALCARGETLHLASDALVVSFLPMTLAHGMGHLRDGGRFFAGYRAARCSNAMRIVWALVSPLVPAVLFARLARAIAHRRPRRLLELARAFPFLVLVLGAWGWGEATGYIAAARGPRAGEGRP